MAPAPSGAPRTPRRSRSWSRRTASHRRSGADGTSRDGHPDRADAGRHLAGPRSSLAAFVAGVAWELTSTPDVVGPTGRHRGSPARGRARSPWSWPSRRHFMVGRAWAPAVTVTLAGISLLVGRGHRPTCVEGDARLTAAAARTTLRTSQADGPSSALTNVTPEDSDAQDRSWGAAPGQLDRRQGVDDPEARDVRPRGGQAGRPGLLHAGALLRALLLPGPGRRVLRLHRAHPRRADDEAHAGPRQADGHGPGGPDVRGGRARLGHLLQHGGGHRRRRHATWASTARRTSRTSRASGRSSTSGRATSAIRSSRRPSARSASTSATTATSRRAPAPWA